MANSRGEEIERFRTEAAAGIKEIPTNDPIYVHFGADMATVESLPLIKDEDRPKFTTELYQIERRMAGGPLTPEELIDFWEDVQADIEYLLPEVSAQRILRGAGRALIRGMRTTDFESPADAHTGLGQFVVTRKELLEWPIVNDEERKPGHPRFNQGQ